MRLSADRFLVLSAILAVAVVPWALSSLGWPLSLSIGSTVALALLTLALLGRSSLRTITEQHRRVLEASQQHYSQLESFLSLIAVIRPHAIVPSTRGFSASPDLLAHLCALVRERKPSQIVELGSGVSTLVLAYCLKLAGTGRLFSIEHDPDYAERTLHLLDSHGLSEIVQLEVAPLVSTMLGREQWLWYELSHTSIPDGIDLLFIDGPPGNTQSSARYPALPILKSRLSSSATVVLDDGKRPDEVAIVKLWIRENPEFTQAYEESEKGTFVLRRNPTTVNGASLIADEDSA